jgi:hypothetical protein
MREMAEFRSGQDLRALGSESRRVVELSVYLKYETGEDERFSLNIISIWLVD